MIVPIACFTECILRFPDGELQACTNDEAKKTALQHIIDGHAAEADITLLSNLPVLDVSKDAPPPDWSFAIGEPGIGRPRP